MKSNEFVKKFGWEESKALVNAQSLTMRQIALSTTVDTKELTRLVESHELVEEYGGLDKAKTQAERFRLNTCIKMHGFMCRIISDVESCYD